MLLRHDSLALAARAEFCFDEADNRGFCATCSLRRLDHDQHVVLFAFAHHVRGPDLVQRCVRFVRAHLSSCLHPPDVSPVERLREDVVSRCGAGFGTASGSRLTRSPAEVGKTASLAGARTEIGVGFAFAMRRDLGVAELGPAPAACNSRPAAAPRNNSGGRLSRSLGTCRPTYAHSACSHQQPPPPQSHSPSLNNDPLGQPAAAPTESGVSVKLRPATSLGLSYSRQRSASKGGPDGTNLLRSYI